MHGMINMGNSVDGKDINPMLEGFKQNKELMLIIDRGQNTCKLYQQSLSSKG